MKSKRLPQNSLETNQSLAEFTTRGESLFSQESENEGGKTEKISSVLASCFQETEESNLSLRDEFSSKTITLVITRCREILQSASKDSGCWAEVREFLEEELWKVSRLKENLVMAERKCQMVRVKLGELANPLDGQENQKRVMACGMLLAESEMHRDHFRDRVFMIIDQFVGRILAGTQDSPGGDILEIRLRGVFGVL
jgi:hypothetical protein